MRQKLSVLGLLALLAFNWSGAQATPSPKQPTPAIGDLVLEPCSTSVAGGKASLKIGVLTQKEEAYVGEYQFKVTPYFFKSEKGTLSIAVSEEMLRKFASGTAVDFTGQATTSGTSKTRRIDGKATPSDSQRGSIQLRFMADSRELQFSTSYHLDVRKDPH